MTAPRILAFSGSTRSASYNTLLVSVAARGAKEAGAEVTEINLRDFPLPLFDEDLERESGRPDTAVRLKKLFIEHDGFLISSPEYNGSITGVLKNAIDWVSRADEGEAPLEAYRGKVVTLMSASPGALGGLRGLVHVRAIFGGLGAIVLPDQVAVSRAFEAFDENGDLRDDKMQERILGLGGGLAEMLGRLMG